MSVGPQLMKANLNESALRAAEDALSPWEQAAPPWKHLVVREHPWRKQLSIKGRNMTVGQLVASIHVNRMSAEVASDNYDLPLEAIQEALQYERDNSTLIDLEFREERRRLKEKGYPLEPQDLPR